MEYRCGARTMHKSRKNNLRKFKNIDVVFLFLVIIVCCVHYAGGDCNLSLQRDFGSPAPVFIQNGAFLMPNKDGGVSLSRSDTLLLACPGDYGKILLDKKDSSYNVLEAHCIVNGTFRVNRWIGALVNVTCNTQPWYNVEDTGQTCASGRKTYRVGYQIRSSFHKLYEACFDEDLLSTLYVQHELTPVNNFFQKNSGMNFNEGKLFKKGSMRKSYKTKHQMETLDNILGNNMAKEYISKKQFLNRGHLAARADFSMHAQQRASYQYINTAPQWSRGNAGDWAALEDSLRRRVQKLGHSMSVYTGTHGVMTLPDSAGTHQQIYLNVDQNGNYVVPVPMYFYKVVYDRTTKKAAAFVSINSSYYDAALTQQLSFCGDTCAGNAQYGWLKWRDDGTHSFCCDYHDFIQQVTNLPTLNVTGRFY